MISYCPEHEDIQLRIEYDIDDDNNSLITGYCNKCAKHYPICCDQSGKEIHMECCTKVKGHSGKHQWRTDYRIMEW